MDLSEKGTEVSCSPELREKLLRLRPIDDFFFRLISGRDEVCREILQTILKQENIHVVRSESQYHLIGVNRSVIADAVCWTLSGSVYNIEVQKDEINDDFRRTRYHAAILTTNSTAKGSSFSEIPDVTVVYISEYDALNSGKVVTKLQRSMHPDSKGDIPINDGETILFANTLINDGSKEARLMQLFMSEEVFYDNEFPALSEAVQHFKTTKEGFGYMCKLTRELIEEGKREGKREGQIELALKMIKNGLLSAEDAITEYGIDRNALMKKLVK